MNRTRLLSVAAAVALLVLLVGAGAEPTSRPAKRTAVVFDFGGDEATGKQLADSVRLKLRRHEDFDVIDRLTTQELTGATSAQTPQPKVAELLTKSGASVALYGSVERSGQEVRAEVLCLDVTDRDRPITWRKTFGDRTERARGLIARRIVEEIRQQAEWTPPTKDEAEPDRFAKPLNLNGDFQDDGGWDEPDNVSTFIEATSGGRGKVLRIRTDLKRDPWVQYRRQLLLGQADPDNPPSIPRDRSYGCVGGLEGVHFRSDWIKAEPGRRYWLVADHRGKSRGMFFAKVFVKGFLDAADQADGLTERSLAELNLTPEAFAALPAAKRKKLIAEDARKHPERHRRECYRWYLACRNETGQWRHTAARFPPRGGLPANVQWLRIEIYCYWPPGEYLWDKVHLYADPRQTKPLAEEKPRTPNVRRQPSGDGD